jgi:RNA polymerase sigma-70 factor (ECF subfamily)
VPTDPNIRKLVDSAKKGNVKAFDQLVAHFERQVLGFAMKLTGNLTLAQDVAQDAFVRAWTHIQTFRGEASFSTWLCRIVLNSYLDFKRRAGSAKEISLQEYETGPDGQQSQQIADQTKTPQELAENREAMELLRWGVAQLPDYQKAMLVMFHFEHLSYDEIAHVMDLPVGTVKSRMNRARIVLREILSPFLEHFGAVSES